MESVSTINLDKAWKLQRSSVTVGRGARYIVHNVALVGDNLHKVSSTHAAPASVWWHTVPGVSPDLYWLPISRLRSFVRDLSRLADTWHIIHTQVFNLYWFMLSCTVINYQMEIWAIKPQTILVYFHSFYKTLSLFYHVQINVIKIDRSAGCSGCTSISGRYSRHALGCA